MPIDGDEGHILGDSLGDQLMVERILMIGMNRQIAYFQHMPFG